MLRYRHIATYRQADPNYLANISGLLSHKAATGDILYSLSHSTGGVAAWRLPAPDQSIEFLGGRFFSGAALYVGSPSLQVLDWGGGHALFASGLRFTLGVGYALGESGLFIGQVSLLGAGRLAADVEHLGQFSTPNGQFLYVTRNGFEQFETWRIGADGAIARVSVVAPPKLAGIKGAEISDVSVADLGGKGFLFAASALGNSVTSYAIEANGSLRPVQSIWAEHGTGLSQPHQLETVKVAGLTYLIVGSAQSSSLTTMRVMATGELQPVDHVIDEKTTRFKGVTALTTATVDGRPFVFAGGGDGGLSVFTVLPDGRLLFLATLVDNAEWNLARVQALNAVVKDGKIVLFVASQQESGISQILFDPGTLGLTRQVGAGVHAGGNGNDLLMATKGTTELRGNDGDDILIAGPDPINLRGGNGADLFVASAVDGRIMILDYEPGIDRLDLSNLGMIRSLAQVTIRPQPDGAKLFFGNSVIWLITKNGVTLQASHFDDLLFPIAHYRPPDMRTKVVGTLRNDVLRASMLGSIIHALAGNDQLIGGAGHDILFGGDGDDTLTGGAGNDTLRGDAGNDVLRGGDGNDNLHAGLGNNTLFGDEGDDLIRAGHGNNRLFGGRGNDTLETGNGHDVLYGEVGDNFLFSGGGNDSVFGSWGRDYIHAGAGNDVVNGDAGSDTIFGQDGDDRLRGGAGNDTLQGNNGHDMLMGEDGDDALFGQAGNDTLSGGAGNDRLEGGPGDDVIYGDEGEDRLVGDLGNDTLWGQGGRDWLFGGEGDDTLNGGDGNDLLYGDGGNDRLHAGAGHDLLHGGAGGDTLIGDLGNDTLWGGPGSDLMSGGAGGDTFILRPHDEGIYPDTISDFQRGVDILNIRGSDLLFIGTDPFSRAPEVRFDLLAGTGILLRIDFDGDGIVDLRVQLTGLIEISESDFLL